MACWVPHCICCTDGHRRRCGPGFFHRLLGLLSVTGAPHSRSSRSEIDHVDLGQVVLDDPEQRASADPVGCPSIGNHSSPCWLAIFSAANSTSACAAPTTCSFRTGARGSTAVGFIEPSTCCRGNSAPPAPGARKTALGGTTSGIASQFENSPTGTSRAMTQRRPLPVLFTISGTSHDWPAPTPIPATRRN